MKHLIIFSPVLRKLSELIFKHLIPKKKKKSISNRVIIVYRHIPQPIEFN